MELFINLGLALGTGLLIGTERGWKLRAADEGSRMAGIRTFGLVGLLGGLWALLAEKLGGILLGVAFGAFAILLIVAHLADQRVDRDVGITTVVAALITFALGALAPLGYPTVAAIGAVVTAGLLSLKPTLHRWLQHLEAPELYGALKFLFISVVGLPVLPNQGYGPWQALNPYEIWWMVVLIAGISFAGYISIRVAGTGRGILVTGALGGLVSSTALTLSFARLGQRKNLSAVLAAGILVAGGTMFPRSLVEVAAVNPGLLRVLVVPMVAMTVTVYAAAGWFWFRRGSEPKTGELPLQNPFELGPAIKFGLLLAGVMLLAPAARATLGHGGIYLLSALSGITDVDAITLSMARMARADLAPGVAVHSIVIAAVVNTLVKGGLVWMIAGPEMGRRVGAGFGLASLIGLISLLLIPNPDT